MGAFRAMPPGGYRILFLFSKILLVLQIRPILKCSGQNPVSFSVLEGHLGSPENLSLLRSEFFFFEMIILFC